MKFLRFILLVASIIFHRDCKIKTNCWLSSLSVLYTYVDGLVKDLEGDELNVVVIGELEDFVDGHPGMLVPLILIQQLVRKLHLQKRSRVRIRTRNCLFYLHQLDCGLKTWLRRLQ